MSAFALRFRKFLIELKRRKVFRVALMYGVVAWALINVAETIFPVLEIPVWTVRFVIVAAVLGFPIALVLSWAYELKPEDPAPGAHDGLPTAAGSPGDTATTPTDTRDPRGEPPSPPTPSVYRLPPSATPFIGRERDLDELRRLIEEPTCRLITICGPGGVGKTRFALQAAMASADAFEHGAVFVPLAVLADSKPLVSTVAERLQLPLSGRGDARSELLAYLREKHLLLIMDNFEHLSGSGSLLTEMLEHAPRLTVLATSRERLGLYGEALFPLEGLGVPQIGTGEPNPGESEAVQLFLESARRVQPLYAPDPAELRAIGRICHAVDGLPLAIELAAAWVRAFSCEQILREIRHDRDFLADTLGNVPERHRSMRAAFESAWRLLSDEERKAYRRLTVFRGGCEAAAATEIVGASLSMLSVLLDKSLLRRSGSGRFEILEVLRQYAEDKLREDADEYAWVRQHHCQYYTGLVQDLGSRIDTPDEKTALDRMGEEVQNIREAWRWAVEHRLEDRLDGALHGLFGFHEVRGRAQEGWELIDDAAAGLANSPESGKRAGVTSQRLLVRQAVFSAHLGRAMEAAEQMDAAIARLRMYDRPEELAFALDRRGVVAFALGSYGETRAYCSESLALARAAVDASLAGYALLHLGGAAFAMGGYPEAEQRYQEALVQFERGGALRGVANCQRNLGVVAGVQEHHAAAQQRFQAALMIYREIGDSQGVAGSLQNLGHLAWQADNPEQAETYLREAVALSRGLGLHKVTAACLNTLGNVAYARKDFGAARDHYHRALATAAENNDTPFVLEVLVGIARLMGMHEGQAKRAYRLVALVLESPASDHDTRTSAEKLKEDLETLLPAPMRGTGAEPPLPLDAAVAGILAEGGLARRPSGAVARR
jgi:predicted ATPase/Tfp pilus assembly protein PilF